MCRDAWKLRLAWYFAPLKEQDARMDELQEHLDQCSTCKAEWEVDKRRLDVTIYNNGVVANGRH